jgi:hypothetical protein
MEDIRKGVCPLCRHNEVLRSTLCAITADGEQAAIAVAREEVSREQGIVMRARGRIASNMCRRCGFTQLFTSHPDEVPVGSAFGTSLVKGPDPDGPYR